MKRKRQTNRNGRSDNISDYPLTVRIVKAARARVVVEELVGADGVVDGWPSVAVAGNAP